MRVLGLVQSDPVEVQGAPAQYFEKGRLEDHRHAASNPAWALAYGRLTVELLEHAPHLPISGTSITYGDLQRHTEMQQPAPPGFAGGTMVVEDGVFVPAHPQLQPAPGYVVPPFFWEYINREDLFPGGWLHDVGLPLANAFAIQLDEQGSQHTITMQPFERTVLTYDTHKPQEWQVERANVGTDAVLAADQTPLVLTPPPPRYAFPVQNAECRYEPYHHDYPAADIFCPVGSAFVATTDGVVDFVSKVDQWDPSTDVPAHRGGRSVALIGDDGWRYYGSHLAEVAEEIEPGVRVAAGQLLGRTGRSGNARGTPPHLHYGISHPTTPDDWQVRRGELPPYAYLQAWQRGEMVVPHP
jgi:murein DD-endopeptidase MepM/ murein hydrolase activator NlpD